MPIVINSKKTGELIWNGSPIKEGWYNGKRVYSKRAESLYITGTVTDTAYVPRVYVNSRYNGTSSPAGGTWVDTELDVDTKTWKINLAPYMPWKGAAYMFYYNINANPSNIYIETINIPKNFSTGNLTTMNQMFYRCSNLTNLDVSNFVTSNVTNMYCMFSGCSNLTNLDVGNFDTSNVTTMYAMFYDCGKLNTLDLSGWSTVNVTRMHSMFYYCTALTTVGDISGWSTGNVENMQDMFRNCSNLASLDLSGWSTGNVIHMGHMFGYCVNLTAIGDLSNWTTSNVTKMYGMFRDCRSLTTLGVPPIGDGTKAVDTDNMFTACSALTTVTACGEIHNTVSFSDSPLTLDSAKVVLNALSTPYQGAQTLTLSSTTKGYINADSEALAIVAEKQALGWTIAL